MEWGIDWQQLLLWSSVLSVGALLATLIGVPWIVARLPSDYFVSERRRNWRDQEGVPIIAFLFSLLKNVIGLLLVVLGVVMLVTPGQGVLTLLAGLLLMNFPGKFRLERWLVLRPGVLRALNWLRNVQHQPAFEEPSAQ